MEEANIMIWILVIAVIIAVINAFMLWCCIRVGDVDND